MVLPSTQTQTGSSYQTPENKNGELIYLEQPTPLEPIGQYPISKHSRNLPEILICDTWIKLHWTITLPWKTYLQAAPVLSNSLSLFLQLSLQSLAVVQCFSGRARIWCFWCAWCPSCCFTLDTGCLMLPGHCNLESTFYASYCLLCRKLRNNYNFAWIAYQSGIRYWESMWLHHYN